MYLAMTHTAQLIVDLLFPKPVKPKNDYRTDRGLGTKMFLLKLRANLIYGV